MHINYVFADFSWEVQVIKRLSALCIPAHEWRPVMQCGNADFYIGRCICMKRYFGVVCNDWEQMKQKFIEFCKTIGWEDYFFDELWSNLFCVENKESNGFFWDRKFEINVGQSLLNSLMKVTLVGWYVYPTQDDCVPPPAHLALHRAAAPSQNWP